MAFPKQTPFLALLICIAAVAGCGAPRKASQGFADQTTKPKNIVCAAEWKNSPHFNWVRVDASSLALPANMTPLTYKVFSIDTNQLRSYFAKDVAERSFVAPLPPPFGCMTGRLKASGVLAPELKKRYPQMVSLAGQAMSDANSDIRIDYDGTKMRGQLRIGADVFMLSPVFVGNRHYYIVFHKKDAAVKKQPFEQNFEKLERTFKE